MPLLFGCAAAAGAGWLLVSEVTRGFTNSKGEMVAWIAVLGIVALAPIHLLRKFGAVWSSLGAIYAVEWFVTFGVASLVWLGSPTVVGVAMQRAYISASIALMTLGIGCFWAGYLWLLSRPRSAISSADRVRCEVRWDVVMIVYLIGMAARLYSMRLGAYGFTPGLVNGYTMALTLVGVGAEAAAYAAFASMLDHPQRGGRAGLAIMTAGLVALGLASGDKWEAIRPLLAMGLIYMSYRRRLPKMFLAATTAVLLLVIVPGSQLFRSHANQAVQPVSQLVGAGQIQAVGQGLHLTWGRRLGIAGQWLENRPRSIDQIALIVTQTPYPNSYQRGRLWFLAPVYNLIPRFLWPTKPVLSLEYDFDRTYRHLPSSTNTNTGLTQPGDMYINFGLGGVVAGMFLWGLVQAWLTRRWGNVARPDHLIVLVMAASFILLFQRSITDILLALPRVLAVTWLLGQWMYARTPVRAATGRSRTGPAVGGVSVAAPRPGPRR